MSELKTNFTLHGGGQHYKLLLQEPLPKKAALECAIVEYLNKQNAPDGRYILVRNEGTKKKTCAKVRYSQVDSAEE